MTPRSRGIGTPGDGATSVEHGQAADLAGLRLDRSQLDVQITEIERVTTLVAGHGVTMPTLAEIG